jgi:hypothetical protein
MVICSVFCVVQERRMDEPGRQTRTAEAVAAVLIRREV